MFLLFFAYFLVTLEKKFQVYSYFRFILHVARAPTFDKILQTIFIYAI